MAPCLERAGGGIPGYRVEGGTSPGRRLGRPDQASGSGLLLHDGGAVSGDLLAGRIPDRDRNLEGPRRAIPVRADDQVLAVALAADLPRRGRGWVTPIDR